MHSTDQYIQFSTDSFEVNDQIVITSTGYKDLTLKVTGIGNNWAVEKVTSQTEPEQTKDAPTFVGDQVEISYTDYKIIKPADENTDSDYISKITEISVDGQNGIKQILQQHYLAEMHIIQTAVRIVLYLIQLYFTLEMSLQ